MHSLPYTIRRSPRAKHTRIVVTPDKVEVVAPPQIPEEQIKAFVVLQQGWIRNTLARLADKTQPIQPQRRYEDGACVLYQGREITLQIQTGDRRGARIELMDENRLLLTLPRHTLPESAVIGPLLRQWLKNQARRYALIYIEKHADRFNLHPRSVKLKAQKSRWGSCGFENDINLNWLLILAPPNVFEYVVVHEICHIRHKNHSAAFWALVSLHLPDYSRARYWLKENGAQLMAERG